MLADYQTLVNRLAQADAGDLTPTDVDDAISLAVTRFSKDKPHEQVTDVTAPGGQTLDLPNDWVGGFSDIRAIEFPVGWVPPSYLDDWQIYTAPGGESALLAQTLDTGDTVRLTYSLMHTVDATTDTIPLVYREPVAAYAASLLCEQLATRYAGQMDATIQADTVDHNDKGRRYRTRANDLRKRYTDAVGVPDQANAAAGVVVDWDNNDSRGGDRLFHPRRRR